MVSTLSTRDQTAVGWLLDSDEPGVRLQTRRDLLGEELDATADDITRGPRVRALLDGQIADGGFGVDPYTKWRGAHWRLVSLIDLGIPAGEPHSTAAAGTVLDWLVSFGQPAAFRQSAGRYRVHASQQGNALAVCTRLGMAEDERVAGLARSLALWQWPDGGWNCDRKPQVIHSSFYESITPLLGLAEYASATADQQAKDSRDRAAEFFLTHRVFKSHRRDRVGDPDWVKLQYPIYHYYDVLHGLVALERADRLGDPRTADALALLRSKQHRDGRWHLERAPRWLPSGTYRTDIVRWERSGPSEMLTLRALRVLGAAGA